MSSSQVVGVILAGGSSTRMGEDKSFTLLNSTPLIEHSIARAKPQVSQLLLNTNRHDAHYRALGLPIVPDSFAKQSGPLAGLFASMDYVTKKLPEFSYLATFPVDSPFYPENLVAQLVQALQLQQAQIAIPRYCGQAHWVFGVWSISLVANLGQYLSTERSVQGWVTRQDHCFVDYDDLPQDPFLNINSPSDLEIAANRFKR